MVIMIKISGGWLQVTNDKMIHALSIVDAVSTNGFGKGKLLVSSCNEYTDILLVSSH